ncbi:MAG: chemotaxis protein CheA [Planctomycetes bacterium]|nr:chemotaxis protein CheA [Planctomycetota bacterium]
MMDNEFVDDMLADFIDESDGLLRQLNENLLGLDEWVKALDDGQSAKCDIDLLNEMFRSAHSIKGLSGMLGLDDINALTHKVENVFDAARQDELAVDRDVVDVIFQAVDRLSEMVERLKEHDGEEVDCQAVVERIQQILVESGQDREQRPTDSVEGEFAQLLQANEPEEVPLSEAGDELLAGIQPIQGSEDDFADVVDEQDVSDKYLSIFIAETDESLDLLSELLVSDHTIDAIEPLLVTCHRIKGSAASLGLNRPAKLSHLMEDVLQEAHQQNAPLDSHSIDALLACTDALRSYVEALKSGTNEDTEDAFQAAYCQLKQAVACSTPATQIAAPDKASDVIATTGLTRDLRAAVLSVAPAGSSGFVGVVAFREGLPLVELKARLVYEKLDRVGAVFHCDPAESEIDDATDLIALTFGVVTDGEDADLRSQLSVEGVQSVDLSLYEIDETAAEPEAPNSDINDQQPDACPNTASTEGSTQAQPETTPVIEPAELKPTKEQAGSNGNGARTAGKENKSKPAETLRVDIERLDQLMNLAGQLVINKARFGQIGDGLRGLTSFKQATHSLGSAIDTLGRVHGEIGSQPGSNRAPDLESVRRHVGLIRDDLETVHRALAQVGTVRALVNELGEAVHQLDRVSDGIQKTVMDTRMVPIGPLFSRFRRVVRDITQGNGKEIQLVIRGDKTELDKRMIDELGDPLIHMIRNSCDHGIELPNDRVSAGKSREGEVTLDAFHRGNRIVIQIKDDGKGLDPDKICDKAISRGLVSAADAEKLTSHQIYQMIWEPGFSTAEQVTEVSGRGMGMDIVRSKIESLNGTAELDSEPGKGTTFTIKLPLTMAILPSLLAEIEGDTFAVPVESVVEIVSVERSDINTVHGVTTAHVRGRVISVVDLAELFSWNQPARETPSLANDDTTLVIVGADDHEVGVIVHRLLGEEDIVIKSLAENYENVTGVAGASILGDGRVSLILDVASLLEMSCYGSTHHETPAVAE